MRLCRLAEEKCVILTFFLRFLWELKLHGCHKVGRDRRSGLVPRV